MCFHIQSVISFLLILTCLHNAVLSEQNHIARGEFYDSEPKNATCSTSDLNHSLLVECNGANCEDITNQETSWPKSLKEIVHVYSSRLGDRFAINSLPNLDFEENELERTLNINTTLYVDSNQKGHEIYGFGTFLDATNNYDSKDEETEKTFNQVYEPIFKDLYGKSANQFTILSISVTRDSIIEYKVSQNLLRIDSLAIRVLGKQEYDEFSKIKVILNLDDFERTLDMIEAMKETAKVMSTKFKVLQIWAVSIDQNWLLKNSSNEGMLGYLQELFSTKNTFARTNFTVVPNFVDTISKSRSILRGLIIKSQYSTVYNILNYVKESRKDLKIITVGRGKFEVTEYGDWNTAQNYAVEILNHLKYGSSAFLEAHSAIDILKDPYSEDCPIYSLRQSHGVHFRGPMFYALGHFSRYIVPGSRLLKSNVFTQPNMFAAHYISFITPQNQIISIILNDNDHILPFRLAIDGHILAYVSLQPKSFNTIININRQ